MRKFFALVAAASLCAAQAAAHGHGHVSWQNDFSKVEIKTTKAAGNVYMLEGAGGNIGVIAGPDGLLIVDDQFAPLAEKIRAALKAINPGPLKFVLNTHWHFDHTGGNAAFGREGTLVAHANVRRRLAVGAKSVAGQAVPPAPKEALPVITYSEAVQLHFNGEEVRVVHFPAGHTDGDSVIFFTGSNVIHMGDDFFAGRFPFVDIDSGGSVEGLIRNVGQVIAQAPAGVKIIPGHGPLSSIEDLRTYHGMLQETTSLIRERMRQGKTLEQIKAEGLPEKWRTWGTGFINTDRWIETVHRSLSQAGGGGAKTGAAPRLFDRTRRGWRSTIPSLALAD
ncbi:MAG TPA: MBL fold metallo-hydrolase [Pyrinomonadaceae bacterium]|jgi:glyoxylase-like metal-dependent hydrolase (beta-lactamase superfamily II)|nr:MBL fold metallo-hydrolase [Pyrinomonadaceae bacterium]